MRFTAPSIALLGAVLTFSSALAAAEPPPPEAEQRPEPAAAAQEEAEAPARPAPDSWVWQNLTAVRYNAIGLINRFATGYRRQLLDYPGVLFDQSFAAVLLSHELSPQYNRIGGRLELSPVTVLKLWAQADFIVTHGAFDMLQTFAAAGDEHDDDTLDELSDENQVTTGLAVKMGALLQAKVGPVAARNHLTGHQLRMAADDPLYYDRTLDVLMPMGGWALTNDTDLIYVLDFGLKLGARYTYTHVFYPEHLDLTGAEDNSPTHRIGPAVVYTFFEDPPSAAWNAPTIILMAQWWLKHRYRTGANTSVGLPYILLAFSQRGTFLP